MLPSSLGLCLSNIVVLVYFLESRERSRNLQPDGRVKLMLSLLEKAKCFRVGDEDAVTILSDKWWSWFFFGGGRCLERRTECTLKVKGSSNSSRRRGEASSWRNIAWLQEHTLTGHRNIREIL